MHTSRNAAGRSLGLPPMMKPAAVSEKTFTVPVKVSPQRYRCQQSRGLRNPVLTALAVRLLPF